MDIQMVGIDHTTAPVELREKFSFTTTVQAHILEKLTAKPEISGAVLLATCNRTEIWVHGGGTLVPVLQEGLCAAAGLDVDALRFINREGNEAAAYLFRMTAGLHSRIFGEDQILTQVKEALERARALQCTDNVLEVLFRMAITAAKKAKGKMQIPLANPNAVGCAMDLLQREGYDFQDRICLVIGNGRMGKLAAQSLQEAGADVTVTVRQYRSGRVEIPKGCRRIDYGRRMDVLPGCDIILSATTSPNVTVKYDDLCEKGWKPDALFLDLAVPRDMDPRIGSLPRLRLLDIDSFQVPPSEDMLRAQQGAEEILEKQAQEFITWYDCRDLFPTAEQLANSFGRDTAARLESSFQSLMLEPEICTSVRNEVENAAKKQFRRVLFSIRDEVGADAFRQCLEAMEKCYG